MSGVDSSLHIMLNHCEHVDLHVHDGHGSTFAVIRADDGRFAISGAADQVATTLRELADKVDAFTRARQDAA